MLGSRRSGVCSRQHCHLWLTSQPARVCGYCVRKKVGESRGTKFRFIKKRASHDNMLMAPSREFQVLLLEQSPRAVSRPPSTVSLRDERTPADVVRADADIVDEPVEEKSAEEAESKKTAKDEL